MRADDPAPTRHGAYICIPDAQNLANLPVDGLVEQLELVNEATSSSTDLGLVGTSTTTAIASPASVAFLRRVTVSPGTVEDDGLMAARAVLHVAGLAEEPVAALCRSLEELLAPRRMHVITGAALPMNYTGNRMHDHSYAHRVLQRPAAEAPNAFLLPLNKTAAWWQKSWMERHTYFLPRYDSESRQVSDGHALAAEGGIAHLFRRTYRQIQEPASSGKYDFINYFECADADIEHFDATCAALRDVARNPEWSYVEEGPTWRGRRVASWAELFS